MDLRKTLFILPNLFTLANCFCGFFALTVCLGSPYPGQFFEAALAICFGFFFDLFDGRVARMTRTQSALGVQMDSLADVVTFGAAPAMLVYKWGLSRFEPWGIFIAFLFLAAATFRLARYNVLSATEHSSKSVSDDFFVGLSVPAATAVIISLVVVHRYVGGQYLVYGQGAVATIVVILSCLMVSRIRFRTFKHLRMTKMTLGVAFLLAAGAMLVYLKLRAPFIFVFLMSAYITLGILEEIYRFASDRRRKRREAKLAAGQPLSAEDQDPTDDEAEVLKELTGV